MRESKKQTNVDRNSSLKRKPEVSRGKYTETKKFHEKLEKEDRQRKSKRN